MAHDGVNIPLLREAVRFAEQAAQRQQPSPVEDDWYDKGELMPASDPNQQTWYQGTWASPKLEYVDSLDEATLEHCGTAYCIAGFVASQQPGYKVELKAEANYWDPSRGEYAVRLRETIDGESFVHSQVAAQALGISSWDADWLFSGGNDIDDVRRIAEYIAGEKL